MLSHSFRDSPLEIRNDGIFSFINSSAFILFYLQQHYLPSSYIPLLSLSSIHPSMASFSAVSAMMSFAHGSCRQTDHYSPCVSAVARPSHTLMATRRGRTTIASGVATELPPLMVPAEVDVYDSTEKGSKLAAWSSVREERWEGVVEVDGHVPHWLVSEKKTIKIK